jgi:hypothetical protein
MPNPLQMAGASLPPSDFAPLHVNRMMTGMWPNTNPFRDAATPDLVEKYYGGQHDSLYGGANAEVSTRLTHKRRPGNSVYNPLIAGFPPVNRFYGWNTFTLTDEAVRVLADTGMGGGVVYDITAGHAAQGIFTKSPGAGSTYFLGVGNTLYFTNGVDNKQLNNATGVVTDWGVDGPTTAPTVSQDPRPNPYPGWVAGTGYCIFGNFGPLFPIVDPDNNIQQWDGTPENAVTGPVIPPVWNSTGTNPTTPDGSVLWRYAGPAGWQAVSPYGGASLVTGNANTSTGMQLMMFINIVDHLANSGAIEPVWNGGLGSLTPDANGIVWKCLGPVVTWDALGANCPMIGSSTILDPNGYTEEIIQPGKTGPTLPSFSQIVGAYTSPDGTAAWMNSGAFSVAATAPWLYGYAFEASATVDISNMSPQSQPIVVIEGNQVTVQGMGTGVAGVDTIVLYRTDQGGSIFFFLASFPNPGAGVQWTYIDNTPDSGLNILIQAQTAGQGTPLPAGATALAFKGGRIFAAVGNVVYISSGPDAVVSGSSGNAGFDTTLPCQSKIIKFWGNALGMVVFTLKDAYIIKGSGVSGDAALGIPADPFTIDDFLEDIPLLSYDAFTVHFSTGYLFGGQRMVTSLDPSAGIVEASFPLADQVAAFNPKTSFCTFHTGPSGETALYLSDGSTQWYRMSPTSSPETGWNWSPPALITGGMSAVQSVEILPGTKALLIGPPAAGGPILMRDTTVRTDNGTPYPMSLDFNPIVLAEPGQLAGVAWMALKTAETGNTPTLGVVLDEIKGPLETIPRNRQDPPNLPPSETYDSNRFSLLQGQKPVWCQAIKFALEWPATDTPDELFTYTIYGETWAEQRSQ